MNRAIVERAIAAVLVVVSFFVGYAWKQRGGPNANEAVRVDPAGPEHAVGARAAAPTGQTDRAEAVEPRSARSPGDAVTAEDIRQQMAAGFHTPGLAERIMQVATVLRHLSPDNWRGALQAFEDARRQGEENPEAWAFFVRRAGEVIGKDAVTYFVGKNDLEAARSALTGWASTDPSAALLWIGREAGADTHRLIVGAAIRGLALTEPDLAVSAMEGIPIERRKNYVHEFVASVAQGAGLQQTEEIVNGILRRAGTNGHAADDYVREIFADFAEMKARRAALSGDTAGLGDWVKSHLGQPYADVSIIRGTAEQLARVDGPRALGWLDSLLAAGVGADPRVPMGYGAVLAMWAHKDGPTAVNRWLADNTNHPRYDYMVGQYAAYLAESNAAEATRLAATIKDPGWRTNTQKAIAEIVAPKLPAKRK